MLRNDEVRENRNFTTELGPIRRTYSLAINPETRELITAFFGLVANHAAHFDLDTAANLEFESLMSTLEFGTVRSWVMEHCLHRGRKPCKRILIDLR